MTACRKTSFWESHPWKKRVLVDLKLNNLFTSDTHQNNWKAGVHEVLAGVLDNFRVMVSEVFYLNFKACPFKSDIIQLSKQAKTSFSHQEWKHWSMLMFFQPKWWELGRTDQSIFSVCLEMALMKQVSGLPCWSHQKRSWFLGSTYGGSIWKNK